MQTSFVDHPLAVRLEETQGWRALNYAHASAQIGQEGAFATITVGGALVIYGGPRIPVNRTVGLGMYGLVTSEDFATIEEFYNQRSADTYIDCCPLADSSLLPLLQARGYAIQGWLSMLFMPLPSALVETNPAIHVSRATADQAELWLATSARGFDGIDEVSDQTLHVLKPNFFAENATCYIAWQGDTPVATGGMYWHNGVVELGGTSTLVAYRNQGAQGALIQRRLQDAHASGCDLAVVQTSPGSPSQRNMQRRSFQLAYSRAICVRRFEQTLIDS